MILSSPEFCVTLKEAVKLYVLNENLKYQEKTDVSLSNVPARLTCTQKTDIMHLIKKNMSNGSTQLNQVKVTHLLFLL